MAPTRYSRFKMRPKVPVRGSGAHLFATGYVAVLVAAAWLSAAPQVSPPALDQAELKRWSDRGFNSEDATTWRNVGIDPAEAKQWVQSGILFAEWANQWKGEGFGPADAGSWVQHQVNVYTAGDFRTAGFSITEATAWIGHGVRSALRAKEFRDRGFHSAEAGDWWTLEFFPDDAALWKKNGFSPGEALAWRYGEKEFYYFRDGWKGYSRTVHSVEWASEWRKTGFSPAQARLASSYRISAAEASQWLAAGFRFEEAMTWRDSGFGPLDAAKEKAAGLSPVEAEEKRSAASPTVTDVIASWHSDIVLLSDARVVVTETIVVSNGPAGPVRECFSRSYGARDSLRHGTSSFDAAWPSYTFTSVLRDSAPAAYSIEKDASGNISLCIGDRETPVPEGEHIFALRYTTDDRLIALRDRDRLFFDVKGPDQTMTVRSASATVHLPKGADTVAAEGYAGPRDRKYFVARVNETADGDVIEYAATRPLRASMDFQVAVDLTKGFAQPGLWWRATHFDRSTGRISSSVLVFALGLVAALAYFIRVWRRVGRDPKRGPIVPTYEAPEGISPALMSHLVRRRRADDRTSAATLVRLAQCGALVIREREGVYRIEKTGKAATACAPHEAEFLETLFAGTSNLILGAGPARRRLRQARLRLMRTLRPERAGCFAANTRYLWPGLAILAAAAFLGLAIVRLSAVEKPDEFWVAYPSFLAVVTAIVCVTFWALLKAPTPRGRKLLDDIEGFRLFLDASYGKSPALHHAPSTETPPALAAHLPYAIALGIDSERASILGGRPDWYTGRSGGFSAADFTSSLNKMAPRAVES